MAQDKINVAEILKDCPSGMELDCTLYEDVYFDCVAEVGIIHCYVQRETYKTAITFNRYGTYNSDIKSKCVIFPKGKTSWEGFVPPCKFKGGDVAISNYGDIHLLRTEDSSYCAYRKSFIKQFDPTITTEVLVTRLATGEEKQKLFDAIKENGYHWNEETKTLEKLIEPKFKVGDWIEFKYYERKPEKVIRIENNVYWLSSGTTIMLQDESAWDLTTKKFDINTLKPFDKVLVRDGNSSVWTNAFFGFYDTETYENYPFVATTTHWAQCIPYEGNKHLLGTTNDCEEYYKTWK